MQTTMDNNYDIGNTLIAKRDYLDLFKKLEKYEVVSKENCLGDEMFYVSHGGKKISGWGLKKFEIDINFDRI